MYIGQGAFVEHPERMGESVTIGGAAQVTGSAVIYGNATIGGFAEVMQDARVTGCARVSGNAVVGGEAVVDGTATVYGTAQVYGCAEVSGNAVISGNARIRGNAFVSGNTKVADDADVFLPGHVISLDGLFSGTVTVYRTQGGGHRVAAGCQIFQLTDDLEMIASVHGWALPRGWQHIRDGLLEAAEEWVVSQPDE